MVALLVQEVAAPRNKHGILLVYEVAAVYNKHGLFTSVGGSSHR